MEVDAAFQNAHPSLVSLLCRARQSTRAGQAEEGKQPKFHGTARLGEADWWGRQRKTVISHIFLKQTLSFGKRF